MEKRLILLSFLSIVFTKNEYPFFTDTKQQLKFEEKRTYTLKQAGSHMYNMSASADVEYTYDWNIIQNNKSLTEIEFLSIVGLNDKRSMIIDSV